METQKELKLLGWITAAFWVLFFLPVENKTFITAITAALDLSRWYAREHVVLCLLPAFFIAGVIAVFVSQNAVLKYFGANAKKWMAYTVASVSGTILAVCSCTILPLFSSIHKRGAGLGPAIAFLYSGPAINILAIILTARILGFEMGLARTIGAVVFSVVIGLAMSLIYRKEEQAKREEQLNIQPLPPTRPMWQTAFHFFTLVLILVFANWGKPSGENSGMWFLIWSHKWHITALLGLALIYSLIKILKINWEWVISVAIVTGTAAFISFNTLDPKFAPILPMIIAIVGLAIITTVKSAHSQNFQNWQENREWTFASWDFAKQILPLLVTGVLIAGFLLGSTHDTTNIPGIIPNEWVSTLVGSNSLFSNLFASVIGAFMYFATLTEIPILQGLMAAGMGKGPALALLLAGPSLSLPNMLVIRGVIGTEKTVIYVLLVIAMATLSGLVYGFLF